MTETPIDVRRQRQLDRQANSSMVRPVPSRFTCVVVGVSFADAYPDNVRAVEQLVALRVLRDGVAEPLPAVLIRDAGNAHDPNAVQVHVPSLGDVGMIGHLPRAVAARVAPELDAGRRWMVGVFGVSVHPEHPDRPGIHVVLTEHPNTTAGIP